MSKIKIVVRFADGRLLKGTTDNFNPNEPEFHLTPVPTSGSHMADAKEPVKIPDPEDTAVQTPATTTAAPPASAPIRVNVRELKAVFVVHDFAGKPEYKERNDFSASNNAMGMRLQIEFKDGEKLLGCSMNFDLHQQGFFIFPADPNSNNQRIYVVSESVKDVKRVA